ncbi:MAG: 2Fe-2S iron-sulfur cluster binding domain-containing protein [Alphaproteobacteria bacterium]|nr:2Fe-2S iron-sulfur cluster binding domain-containing protein [Alphaproteobacteria bacterium]
MPKITVIDKGGNSKDINAETGWSFMEILRDEGYAEIEGACGGSMACATCHMYVHPDWADKVANDDNEKTEEEEDMLDLAFSLTEYSRLGCQIRMSDALDGIVVAIPGAKVDW